MDLVLAKEIKMEGLYLDYLCIANTWFGKTSREKITFGSGCSESGIDVFIIGKVDRNLFKYIKVI